MMTKYPDIVRDSIGKMADVKVHLTHMDGGNSGLHESKASSLQFTGKSGETELSQKAERRIQGRHICPKAGKSILGEGVMKQCTPLGASTLPALPRSEMKQLKYIMLQQFPQ